MGFSRDAVLQGIDSLLDMQYEESDRKKMG